MAAESEPKNLWSVLRRALESFIEVLHDEQLQYLKPEAEAKRDLWGMLASMKEILHNAWVQKSKDTPELLLVLAIASRDPRLRPLLGGCLIEQRFALPGASILAYVLDDILAGVKGLEDESVLENALRLISNCVSDTNCNRKLALQKNAIKTLLRLAKERRSIDFVIPTLYNLCVEYDEPSDSSQARTPATARTNPAQVELAHSDPEDGVVPALFAMSGHIADQRKPLLAGLIEMVSLTAPEDLLCIGISPEMHPQARRRAAYNTVLLFSDVGLVALIPHDGDTAVSLCNAFVNLLAAPDFRHVMISERQLGFLASLHYIVSKHKQGLLGTEDEDGTVASLQQCEEALLQAFYMLCGLPDFTRAYKMDTGTRGSEFIQTCIETPRKASLGAQSPIRTDPTVAMAYIVLANITVSGDIAVKLVYKYGVHEPLQAILCNVDDADTIYPALAFLSRLSLTPANRREIVSCGMLSALRRFLGSPRHESPIDWKPAPGIEALTVLRRLVSGHLETLALLYENSDQDSYMQDILDLYGNCKDSSTKLEIGRLCVEHFRTISSAQVQLESQSRLSEKLVSGSNLATPTAFLACEGHNPGAKAEGWFGLGLMTFWDKTRAQVFEVMKTARMVEEVGKVADATGSSDGASADNLKLVLSKLELEESTTNVDQHTREVFTSAKQKLGLLRTITT